MAQPGGYVGRFLHVDLSRGTLQTVEPPEPLLRPFVGGYGIGARLLYDMVPPGADPLGPDNVLGFVTGPLTGTPAIIGSRYCVVAKSPLTGGWGDANSGGEFGPVLKFSGYDGLLVRGVAEKPVYLRIEDGRAELLAAGDLWGLDTAQTQDALRARHGHSARVACIGPAGERLALISCIINDGGRAAGRSGLGAVMGSKKLKAVVVSGGRKPRIAHPDRLQALRQRHLALFKTGGAAEVLRVHGTSGFAKALLEMGRTPVRNWAGAYPDDYYAADAIDGPAIAPRERRKYACWHCVQACGAWVEAVHGGERVESHRPEYETLATMGTYCQIDDLEAIITLNEICNRAGLDTISAGATIAFAMECYAAGILSKPDLDGQSLEWGDGQAAVALLQKMVAREAAGDLLADGVWRASQRLGRGSEAYAIHAGGQELPAHDPRHLQEFGLAYQVSPTPGRHTQGGVDAAGIPAEAKADYGIIRDPETHDPDAFDLEMYAAAAAHLNVLNAAGLCSFGAMTMEPAHVPDYIAAVTGWDFDMPECLEAGERIEVMRHLFGLRQGYNPLQVTVAPRALGIPPLSSGPRAGARVDLASMLEQYVAFMDWDPVTAMPSRQRLARLGLDAIASRE